EYRCGHPYSEEEVEALLRSGVPESSIRERALSCGTYGLRPDHGVWLTKFGASQGLVAFLEGLPARRETLPPITLEGSTTLGQPSRLNLAPFLTETFAPSVAEDLIRGWLKEVEKSTVPHTSSDGQTTHISAVMPDGRLQRVSVLALGSKYA